MRGRVFQTEIESDADLGYQNHWSERGRATSVANAYALARPRRSVLSLAIMRTKPFLFVVPTALFALAIAAWVRLGNVATSDIAAGMGNSLRQLFGGPESPTHPVLGWILLSVAILSFVSGLFSVWYLFVRSRRETRG